MQAKWSSLVLSMALSGAFLTGCSSPGTADAGDTGNNPNPITPTDAQDIAPQVDAQDITTPPTDVADVPTTDTVTTDAADTGAPSDGGTGACELRRVMATTTDFTVGGYVVGDLATRTLRTVAPPSDGGVQPSQDHVVRTSGCMTFDLWRSFSATANTLAVINADEPYRPLRTIPLEPVPTGAGGALQAANPYDVAVLSPTRAYVTQYNSPVVMIVDPSRDGAAARVGMIDLSPLADADGIPEADAIAVVGGRAYISLQLIDRATYTPPARSAIAVIDTATNTLVDTNPATPAIDPIQLSYGNPSGRMAVSLSGLRLLVVSSGNAVTPAAEGGLDVIDLGERRSVLQLAGSDARLGGDPTSVEVVGATTAWITVNRAMGDAGTTSVILEYDFQSGTLTTAPRFETTTASLGGLRRAPDGTIWAIDTGFGLAGSVHAFDATGRVVLAPPFATSGFNTYSLDFVP